MQLLTGLLKELNIYTEDWEKEEHKQGNKVIMAETQNTKADN